MFIAMLIGMVIGLVGLPLPEFVMKFITVSGDCMSPIAMLLTGVTVSAIDLKKTFPAGEVVLWGSKNDDVNRVMKMKDQPPRTLQ